MMTDQMVISKSDEIHAMVDQLQEVVRTAVEEQTPLHQVEEEIFRHLLAMGYKTLQGMLDQLGHGNVGDECELEDGRRLKRSQELKIREYLSVFGKFSIDRYIYAQREGQKAEFIPLDARLALPESKFSYLLQDFDQHLAVEAPFQQVSNTIQRILGIRQHVDSLERTNRKIAEHAEQFHSQQKAPSANEEGAIFVETADGKGVPIRRPADAPPIESHQPRSGPKPDRKKIATVASVYSVDPYQRTAEEVVESLFRKPSEPRSDSRRRPRPCHKRVRACLNYTDAEGEEMSARAIMFGWMIDEINARNPDKDKPIVCIMDGEESLWNEIDVFQENDKRIEILDLLHVTPRLWKAAHLFCCSEKERIQFVRQRVLSVLQGQIGSVIRGLRRMATQRLSKESQASIETICQYFENNRHRMRYDQYLAQGYPIASGVIEGACRHVVKDRMERTGMNWVVFGAKAMLELRSIYLSNNWDDFVDSYYTTETKRLHPHRDLLNELPWQVAA